MDGLMDGWMDGCVNGLLLICTHALLAMKQKSKKGNISQMSALLPIAASISAPERPIQHFFRSYRFIDISVRKYIHPVLS